MMQKLKDVKPLIIGLGVAGKRHLEAQLNLGWKTGVYSINPKTLDLYRDNPKIIVFDTLEDSLEWCNLIHVCTPDDKHTECVAEALKRKKAVLCEKSFTTNLKDALYLQELAHQNDIPLIIGQNYRLTPTFVETKRRVLTGELGVITKIETTYLHDKDEYQKRNPIRKNQDFLYIAGSHAVDLACWIINQPVLDTQTTATKTNPISYQITLKFASGLLADIKLDASSPQTRSGTDLIVKGEKGQLISHNKVDQLIFQKRGDKKSESINLLNNTTLTTALEVKIVDDFLLGKTSSYEPLPGVDEAVNTIRVLDTIQKAITSGKNELVDY